MDLKQEVWRQYRHNYAKMHPLRTLFWECTLRCNMHCRHCGSDCKVSTQTPDMPAKDFFKAIDDITPHVNPHEVFVIFTGGEALLRPDCCDPTWRLAGWSCTGASFPGGW